MKRFIVAALAFAAAASIGTANAATVLITGSNRGLGLEFAKQYAERGYTVIATARNPSDAKELQALAAKHKALTIERLDVLDAVNIDALAAKYKGQPIDILLNNAGVLGGGKEQTFGTLDRDAFNQVMDTNVFAVLAVTQAFRANVAASTMKKVVSVTSPAGSFTPRPPVVPAQGKATLPPERAASTTMNSNLFYGASKAALNHAMRNISRVLRRDGIIVGLVAPYTVETDMLRETGYARPAVSLPDGVAGLIKVIDGMTMENTSKPIGDDGYVMEW